MEDLHYPAGLPEKCQTCPALVLDIVQWNTLQAMGDVILQQNATHSKELIAVELCNEMVLAVAAFNDEDLNPGIDADRLRAAELLQANHGQAFEAFARESAEIEESMQNLSEKCAGQGPIKARVAGASGSVIVSLCRAHVTAAIAEPGEQLLGRASIHGEKPKN